MVSRSSDPQDCALPVSNQAPGKVAYATDNTRIPYPITGSIITACPTATRDASFMNAAAVGNSPLLMISTGRSLRPPRRDPMHDARASISIFRRNPVSVAGQHAAAVDEWRPVGARADHRTDRSTHHPRRCRTRDAQNQHMVMLCRVFVRPVEMLPAFSISYPRLPKDIDEDVRSHLMTDPFQQRSGWHP